MLGGGRRRQTGDVDRHAYVSPRRLGFLGPVLGLLTMVSFLVLRLLLARALRPGVGPEDYLESLDAEQSKVVVLYPIRVAAHSLP
jgi:hypothetical protein